MKRIIKTPPIMLLLCALASFPSLAHAWAWTTLGWEAVKEFVFGVTANIVSDQFKDTVTSEDIAQLNVRLAAIEANLQRYATENKTTIPAAELAKVEQLLANLHTLANNTSNDMQSVGQRIAGQATLLATLGQQVAALQTASKPATTTDNPQMQQFKLNYVYRRQGRGEFKPFGNGDTLHSGDTFKIIMQASETSYVYLFQSDSKGNVVRLFPMEKFAGVQLHNLNPMQAGKVYYLPNAQQSFQLDNNVGTETIFFTAYRQPNPVLENFYAAIERTQQAGNTDANAVLQTEFKQVLNWQSYGITDALVDDAPVTVEENGVSNKVPGRKLKDLAPDGAIVLEFEHR